MLPKRDDSMYPPPTLHLYGRSNRVVLRDDGMSYGGCVDQLTYLLFLIMADERTKPPL